jgi:hypothetical protein
MTSGRVQSAEEWGQLWSGAEAVFDLSSRLPFVVSRLQTPGAPFFDGDVIFGDIGWGLASSLAVVHGDPIVNVLVVEPDTAAFISTIGEYGGFSCPSSGTVDCYLAGLFGEASRGVAGQIGYAAETVAVFGTSGRWGIWVERNVAGLVVSTIPSALAAWELENGPFLDADDAIDGFIGVNLGGPSHSSEFARTLRRNYGVFRDERQEDT